jgi:DNA-binding transcriptional LysR family regulator
MTDAGRKLFDYARRIEGMTEEIRSEVASGKYVGGSLTIRVPETLASVYMPAIVERFYAQHPDVKLIFINCSDRQLREELNSGRIDLAFLIIDSVHLSEVNVCMLKKESLALISGPLHPLSRQKRVKLSDLEGQTLLLPKTDCSYRKAFERSLEQQNIRAKILEFSSITSMHKCLKRGIGITLSPQIAVQPDLARGHLKKLKWDIESVETPVIMIWHSEKWCSPLLKHFMSLSREIICN